MVLTFPVCPDLCLHGYSDLTFLFRISLLQYLIFIIGIKKHV